MLAAFACQQQPDEGGSHRGGGSALVPLTSISLNMEIGGLPGPQRLRLFTADSVKLHVASMASMLLPAPLERALRLSFATAGAATVFAGVAAWLMAGFWPGARAPRRRPTARSWPGGDRQALLRARMTRVRYGLPSGPWTAASRRW
ncbi:hypothetical protein ACFV27_38660 [Streptomyces antimycoticus]|uniref:hypothetical protein n=1 Tax=Streptomyces antimycoticus TaxID=68175 RepID=UPI0036882179